MALLEDIQGSVLRQYTHPFARYDYLRIRDPEAGRAWLRRVIDAVTSVSGWDRNPQWTFNIAFSISGLEALGQSQETLASFPEAFRQGMAERGATLLCDTGSSDPSQWRFGADPTSLHALVAIHAGSETLRDARYQWHKDKLDAAAVSVFERQGALLPGLTEHFGFRDGFGQPEVHGSELPAHAGQGKPMPGGGWSPIALGEFVLGHKDETGRCEQMPEPAELGRNGSYLVVRELDQDVAAFRAFLKRSAGPGGDTEWVAARMVGRWRSGAPLVRCPDRDDPALGADLERNNDFCYKDEDPLGRRCPLGAHIRRVNPRDALPDVTASRHRILRRGMPFGPALEEGTADDGKDRGIVFIAVNANISRQFEFIQRNWVNDGDFVELGRERDPILGNHDEPGLFTIPNRPVRKRLEGLSSFVRTRGGGYFFAPGIEALRYLSRNPSS